MNENKPHILHFSLGPVQGFIAQARRTRDLWAGSFLLSWLTGQAMAEVVNQDKDNNKIEFPQVENDDLFNAITGNKHNNPHIATLPNRFKASVSEEFDHEKLTEIINAKWKKLADAVWDAFVKDVSSKGQETESIWNRQIESFWQVQWIIDESGDPQNDLLDKRKNWRNHCLSIEGGKHCTTMGDYQEISGHLNSNDQDDFWQALREKLSNDKSKKDYLNLRPNERLCAIALVKRLFVKLSKDKLTETIGWVPNGNTSQLANFPSTTYMAALPWLAHLADKDSGTLEAYYQFLEERIDTDHLRLLCSESHTDLGVKSNFAKLDGNLFNQTALMNSSSTVLSGQDYSQGDPDEVIRKEILAELKKIAKSHGQSSNFYALLLMDGDSLGKLMRDSEDPSAVSKCLATFAQGVDKIVKKHKGVTIYAGGDDVLALVSLHRVMDCAYQLNETYRESFNKLSEKLTKEPTISAAIIFSHFHNPFTEVIREAHHQLDTIAKDQNGRNSLAIAIMKPGNLSAQWVNKWDVETKQSLAVITDKLRTKELSMGFYYKITERYKAILDQHDSALFSAVIKAELEKTKADKSAENKNKEDETEQNNTNIAEQNANKQNTNKQDAADEVVKNISQICKSNCIKPNTVQLSALYIAKFLATEDKNKGKEP